MKRVLMGLYILFSVLFLIYLSIPNLPYPEPIPNSKQSIEQADTETPTRRAYFTDFTREDVLKHYKDEFSIHIVGYTIPSFMLSYPPEDAYPLIRDQTRSTHLREIVYPFRESFFVNEFVPKEAKDDIWYKGTHYEQKVTVSIKQSTRAIRVVVGIVVLIALYFVVVQTVNSLAVFTKQIRRLKFPFFGLK